MGAEAVRCASVARCLPTVGSHSETSLPVSDMTWDAPSDCSLRPRPFVGLPIVIPDSIALGRLSKPQGAQPSNLWTVTGSVPFIVFCNETSSMALNRLSWFLGARGAPEPPPGARGRSGVS